MIAICGRSCNPGGVINGSWGDCGSSLAWEWPFPDCGEGGGGLWLNPKSRARRVGAPCLPRFILLVSFSDTLLVVLFLDMI